MGSDIVPFKPKLPEVVDDNGQVVEGPGMDEVIKLLTGIAQNAQLARIHRDLARRQIIGEKETVLLSATGQVQFKDCTMHGEKTPWAKANIVNLGPNPVYIAVNSNHDYTILLQNTALPIDYTEADYRILYIMYYCDPGNTTNVQIVAFR